MVTYPSNSRLAWGDTTWIITSSNMQNVWVDDENYLHMVLRKVGGVWTGVNMEDATTRLYGRISIVAHSESLNLERNTTFGVCTYKDDQTEIDIEINQWPGYDQHAWFSNQPASIDDHPTNIHYGVLSTDPYLDAIDVRYTIEWTPEYIYYSIVAPDGHVIFDWTYLNGQGTADIPSVASSICLDLLPLAGTYFPATGTYFEIVLSSYEYDDGTGGINAGFTSADLNSGCATQFMDSSSGNPTSWLWNFGDGNTSTKKNPAHRYANNGTYNVTLTASNALSSDSITRTVTIS